MSYQGSATCAPLPRALGDQYFFWLPLSWKILILLAVSYMPTGPSYEYAKEVHLTAFVRDNTASYSEAARDVGSATGDEVGRWSGASSFVYITGILGRSFAGTGCSVGFLKQGSALTADLTYSVVEVKGGAGYAVG
jgi:hypothetical protein